MKRNNLTTAVLAGLAGAAGIAGSAQAVNLNPDGLGQVLIYPYYTTNGDNSTVLSVVNTTDEAKAVKVRFLESRNSREVLDFNLYLSPFDVWTAAIAEQEGVPTMLTSDTSCTVPYFFGDLGGSQEFLNFAYTGLDADGGPTDIARAAEGHFEIIEMGVLTDETMGSATAATHRNDTDLNGDPITDDPTFTFGEPDDCGQLVDAWTDAFGVGATDGYWITDNGIDISAPSGGLFGGAAIINAGEGTLYSYDAEAIDNFWSTVATAQQRHTEPGSVLPSLGDANANSDAFIFTDTDGDGNPDLFTSTYTQGIDAVSALFMRNTVMNEYNIEGGLNARSEWVVTFPTKRFYVDPAFASETVPVNPFTVALSSEGDACENFQLLFWNREERSEPQTGGSSGPIVSPPPPDIIPDVNLFELCYETNVIRFGEDNGGAPSEILGSPTYVNFDLVFNQAGERSPNGWALLNLEDYVDAAGGVSQRADDNGLIGLPVTGFWVGEYINGTLGGGSVLANYSSLFSHKYTRAIAPAPAPAPSP